MNLKDLISDVNVNEIYEHIETETLSEWVNAWQKAVLSTLTPPNEPLTLGLVDKYGAPLYAGDTVAADKFLCTLSGTEATM